MTPWELRTTRDCTSRLSATLQTAATGTSTGQPCQTRAVRRASHSRCLMCTSCVTWPTTTWRPTTGTESSITCDVNHSTASSTTYCVIFQFHVLKSISMPILSRPVYLFLFQFSHKCAISSFSSVKFRSSFSCHNKSYVFVEVFTLLSKVLHKFANCCKITRHRHRI